MKGMVNYLLASIEEFEHELERDIIRKDSLKKQSIRKENRVTSGKEI